MPKVLPGIPHIPSIAQVAEVERLHGSAAALEFATRGCNPVTGEIVNPHHAKLIGGRVVLSDGRPGVARASVLLRCQTGQAYVSTGWIDGATKEQALEVLEQVLLDALSDVRAMRSK